MNEMFPTEENLEDDLRPGMYTGRFIVPGQGSQARDYKVEVVVLEERDEETKRMFDPVTRQSFAPGQKVLRLSSDEGSGNEAPKTVITPDSLSFLNESIKLTPLEQ